MDLTSIALDALATNDFGTFGVSLQRLPLPDAFSVLCSHDVANKLEKHMGDGGVAEWIVRQRTWDTGVFDARTDLSPAETLLHLLWQDLRSRLTRALRIAFERLPLGARGAILCFFGGMRMSIVVAYQRFMAGAISLRPIAAIEHPVGLFDIHHLLARASPEKRNALKAATFTVDKLVFQRGVLIHVDRQRENVFGPTIDTVLLGEALAQWLESQTAGATFTALEVGCGNGLLCNILAIAENITLTYALDANADAVTCTLKNLTLNGGSVSAQRPTIKVRAERFDGTAFPESSMDIIVCNPPYVPDDLPDAPPVSAKELGSYYLAVGRLDLIQQLLTSLDRLLSNNGGLLLMTSSVSKVEVESLLPPGFETISNLPGGGRHRVPLDLEVVWGRREWQKFLLREGRIEADADGVLWHYIEPVWVVRKGGRFHAY